MAHAPDLPAAFEREMGCTADELRYWLPGATAPHALTLQGDGARVRLAGGGTLTLRWQPMAPRRIALLSLPRLQLAFAFEGADAAARTAFMQRFDLYTQRGGG